MGRRKQGNPTRPPKLQPLTGLGFFRKPSGFCFYIWTNLSLARSCGLPATTLQALLLLWARLRNRPTTPGLRPQCWTRTGGARSTSFAKAPQASAAAQPPSQSSSELAGGGARSTSFRKLLALCCGWRPPSAASLRAAAAGACSTSFGVLLGDGWRRRSLIRSGLQRPSPPLRCVSSLSTASQPR